MMIYFLPLCCLQALIPSTIYREVWPVYHFFFVAAVFYQIIFNFLFTFVCFFQFLRRLMCLYVEIVTTVVCVWLSAVIGLCFEQGLRPVVLTCLYQKISSACLSVISHPFRSYFCYNRFCVYRLSVYKMDIVPAALHNPVYILLCIAFSFHRR